MSVFFGWLSGQPPIFWMFMAVIGFLLVLAIRETWFDHRPPEQSKHILTDLELEMLQFIAEAIRDRPVTTSAIITHDPFMEVSPYLLEQSLINLRNLGYIVATEASPEYFIVSEITGEGLEMARS